MGLRPPSREDLRRAASLHNLDLSEEELEGFLSIASTLIKILEPVDQMPADQPVLEGVVRDQGGRPQPQDDPLNAIVRRCSVKGPASGRLSGVRVGLKDNISVAGIPMTCGSRILSGYVPDVDATVVRRLLKEGAEIVAILNMDDFAMSGSGDTSAYGPVLNPHNPQHLAGGSSAGSGAALHYDDIDVTLGCDQGGSIRFPAAWCGVVGLKPTFGLVPYTGIVGGELGVDHVGPMARSVEEVAKMLEVIAGKDTLDPRQGGEVPVEDYTKGLDGEVKRLKVGVVKEGFGADGSEEEVEATVRKAIGELEELGMETREISIPTHSSAMSIYSGFILEGIAALLRDHGLGYGWRGYYQVGLAETMGRALKAQANDLPANVKCYLLIGTYLSQYYFGRIHGKAQNLLPSLRAGYDSALEEVDILAMPTSPIRPFKYDPEMDWKSRVLRDYSIPDNCGPFNATGHPGISIPCGVVGGLPVGLMLIGKHFRDILLLRVAYAFQQHIDWEKL